MSFTTLTSFSGGPLSGAVESPGTPDWWESAWFGSFYRASEHWIYHADLGWLYVTGENQKSTWLWSMRLGWLWTGKNVYPYLYRQEESNWYLFMKNVPGRTLLFRYADRQWIDWNADN